MRFLIIPNFPNPYDQRMVDGLAKAFRQLGHEAIALRAPVGENEVVLLSKTTSTDVLFQVNRARPSLLPTQVRHVAWFQDPVMPSDLGARSLSSDVIYTITGASDFDLDIAGHCRLSSLQSGVDGDSLPRLGDAVAQDVDFSLCGYMPSPLRPPSTPHVLSPKRQRDLRLRNELMERPIFTRFAALRRLLDVVIPADSPPDGIPQGLYPAMRGIVEAMYRPLRGELDMVALTTLFEQAAQPFGRDAMALPGFKSLSVEMSREYPRFLDRFALVTAILEVSDSVELYGFFWEHYGEFAPYSRGEIFTQRRLFKVYQRSRVNLANNTHGLGLHSRTLECMAVGGFVFTHQSPNDDKPGGIRTSFEPGKHYGMFTPDTLRSEAKRWLEDAAARKNAGEEARKIVMDKHLWRHRAQQILDDLV